MKREDELRQLREVLGNLASEAEKELVDSDEQSFTGLSQLNISPTSCADDASSSFDYSTTDNSGYTSSSDASSQPFSHPLGFLHALFPQVSPDRLKAVLANHDGRIDDLDMEVLVEEVLTTEYMRELEERGLDESESMELGLEAPWELVERKKKGGEGGQKASYRLEFIIGPHTWQWKSRSAHDELTVQCFRKRGLPPEAVTRGDISC